MYRSALVPSLLTAAVLLTACGGDGSDSAAEDRPGSSAGSSAPATTDPATTDPATTDPATADGGTVDRTSDEDVPAGGGTDGGTGGAGGTTGRAPAPPAPATPATPDGPGLSDPDGAGPLPPEVVPTQGAQVWAVYLATGSPIDEWQAHKLGETEAYLTGLYGYAGSGIGAVACDVGAAEQLGFVPDDNRLAVYFATAEDAQTFVAVYDRQDVGSARVTTSCRD